MRGYITRERIGELKKQSPSITYRCTKFNVLKYLSIVFYLIVTVHVSFKQ